MIPFLPSLGCSAMKPNKLLTNLKRLGIRDAIVRDYLSGFPTRPGQQPKITPNFTGAQLAIARSPTH